jgi:hypothetical protein
VAKSRLKFNGSVTKLSRKTLNCPLLTASINKYLKLDLRISCLGKHPSLHTLTQTISTSSSPRSLTSSLCSVSMVFALQNAKIVSHICWMLRLMRLCIRMMEAPRTLSRSRSRRSRTNKRKWSESNSNISLIKRKSKSSDFKTRPCTGKSLKFLRKLRMTWTDGSKGWTNVSQKSKKWKPKCD